ncbi:hypothetical protein AGLY_012482 [Aphis glycines]|uniref:Uncharacterized protein n=1 Tax=Aphis glycines TaxID=307491 RepID=A0A6G0T8M0_APHGL|nr:hypothetical protein AGLY_012482 [Aphis glycines]
MYFWTILNLCLYSPNATHDFLLLHYYLQNNVSLYSIASIFALIRSAWAISESLLILNNFEIKLSIESYILKYMCKTEGNFDKTKYFISIDESIKVHCSQTKFIRLLLAISWSAKTLRSQYRFLKLSKSSQILSGFSDKIILIILNIVSQCTVLFIILYTTIEKSFVIRSSVNETNLSRSFDSSFVASLSVGYSLASINNVGYNEGLMSIGENFLNSFKNVSYNSGYLWKNSRPVIRFFQDISVDDRGTPNTRLTNALSNNVEELRIYKNFQKPNKLDIIILTGHDDELNKTIDMLIALDTKGPTRSPNCEHRNNALKTFNA